MKTLADLKSIRDRVRDRIFLKDGTADCRAVIGMATCGIAAGARPVLNALVDELYTLGIGDRVLVTQCGCIGICEFEPVVEVFEPGKGKVTYVKMTAEKARRVAVEHIRDGHIVTEYTIGASEK